MALIYGAGFLQQSTDEAQSHFFGYNTARAAADSLLLDVWNAATNAGRKWSVDLDGKMYSAALTAGDLLYGVAGGVTGVKRLDSLAIGSAGAILRSDGSVPAWSTATFPLTAVAGDILYGSATNVWSSLAKGTALQGLRMNAGATAPEWAAIVAPAGTLTGTALASGVVSSSLTSVGTLTSLTVGGTLSVDTLAEKTGAAGITLDGIRLKDNAITGSGDGFTIGSISDNQRVMFSASMAPGVGASGQGFQVSSTLTEAASGTHADMTGIELFAPTITAVGAAVTRATTLRIMGAPSSVGATTYALWVASGTTRLGGDLAHEGTNLGFYSTAAIAQQTGVAVTAAGIHAACVALGLFTA